MVYVKNIQSSAISIHEVYPKYEIDIKNLICTCSCELCASFQNTNRKYSFYIHLVQPIRPSLYWWDIVCFGLGRGLIDLKPQTFFLFFPFFSFYFLSFLSFFSFFFFLFFSFFFSFDFKPFSSANFNSVSGQQSGIQWPRCLEQNSRSSLKGGPLEKYKI